jgi:hypothetical protein
MSRHRCLWTWGEALEAIATWPVPEGFAIEFDVDDDEYDRVHRLGVVLVAPCGHGYERWLDPREPLPDLHAMLSTLVVMLLAGHGCCRSPLADEGLYRRGRAFDAWASRYALRAARGRRRVLWP